MSLVLYDSNTSNGLPKVANVAVTPSRTVYADVNGLVELASLVTDGGGNFRFYAPAGSVTVSIERTDYLMTVPVQGAAADVLSVFGRDGVVTAENGDYTAAQVGAAATAQGVPAGGTTGEVLSKASNTDYDTGWATSGGTPGGNPGELQFNSSGSFGGVAGSSVTGGAVSLGDAFDAASVAISTGGFTPGNALTVDGSTPPKIVDSGAASGGLLRYRRVPVSSDQIKNLIATPVEIIPTPGSGKRLVPMTIRYRTAGTTPYTGATASGVLALGAIAGVVPWSDTLVTFGGTLDIVLKNVNPLHAASPLVVLSPDAGADWDNQPLNFINAGGEDYATGDYTLEIAVWYAVETVV